ncbi:class II aldolase/adducin family protein [Mycobacterium sp. NPDC003449]
MTDPDAALIAAGHRLAEAGISPGSSGNLSVRDGDRIVMTGTGTDLGRLTSESLAVLDLDGTYVEGARPSKEVAIHVAMYRRDPARTAVVHLHSPYAVAASCLRPWSQASALPPLTPYFVMRVGQTPRIPFRVPGDPELGALLEAHPLPFRAALLANHGPVVGGSDLDQALDGAVELEEASRITVLTDGMDRELLTPTDIETLTSRWGTDWTDVAPIS